MKFTRLLVPFMCTVTGFAAGYVWHVVPMSSVTAEGVLAYEDLVHPAVTPTYPPGYYLVGRISMAFSRIWWGSEWCCPVL